MIRFSLALILLSLSAAAVHAADGKDDACLKGQQAIAERAKTFHGDSQIAALIAADLHRAKQEQTEGDTDECLEALDHADKLLRGDY